ncbi:MAG: deoxyribonuclease IV [Candidatus Kerfeldbacteria bacterium]|nr:deoxyribonuclease IV [Candidatus Kerfeldbacteria bacterium]
MHIGAHVSAAGGIFNAPANATKLGCETFQVFSRSPQGGPAPKLTPEVVAKFKAEMKVGGFRDFTIHAPYYINYASTTPRIRYGSISVIRDELERGTLLGAAYVVTHLGSTKDAGPKLGFHKTWRGIQRVLDGYKGSTQLLLEGSAGNAGLVGGSFEQLAALLKHIESSAKYKGKVNICLDACHIFAAGYDLRTPSAVRATLKQFDQIVGLSRLKLVHGNDSKFGLGEQRDRHEHIGQGQIGLAGFKTLIAHPKMRNVDVIIETPWDSGYAKDVALLKTLRRR